MHKSRVIILALTAATTLLVSTWAGAQDVPGEWVTYRGGVKRTGNQVATPVNFNLANPNQARSTWQIAWTFPNQNPPVAGSPPVQDFIASPVVLNSVAYIGNTNGVFYAINMNDGSLRWLFPDPKRPSDPQSPGHGFALLGSCDPWGDYGIQASAAITTVNGELAVIFGAPDPNPATDSGNGSARLWALDANDGHLIWSSDVVARVTGCTTGPFPPGAFPNVSTAYHETVKYSAPLVNTSSPPPGHSGVVYVGIDSNEDPIQQGAVKYVDLSSGKAASQYFKSEPNGQIGGDVWNAPASDGNAIYFTTGNEAQWDKVSPSSQSQPNPHYGLSMVKTDPSGSLLWFFQPLPFNLDQDPDWNAGATVMDTSSCGSLIVSVMKDGWTYAVDPNSGSCVWQFPDTGNPGCRFPPTNPLNLYHGPNGFRVPGAAYNDLLVIATGGWALPMDHATNPKLWQMLHGLSVCSPSSETNTPPTVSWLADTQNTPYSSSGEDALGAPTIINGLVYVPTNSGYVLVFADPHVWPPAGHICDQVEHKTQQDCTSAGYSWVPQPALLQHFQLPDGGNAARLRKEVVLAEGLALAATSAPRNGTSGHVYALNVCPNCPLPPACSAMATNYCVGTFTVQCSAQGEFCLHCAVPDVGVECQDGLTYGYNGQLAVAGVCYGPSQSASPYSATGCAMNSFGETCITVTAAPATPIQCQVSSPPLCGPGQRYCYRTTPPSCVPDSLCTYQKPQP